MLKTLQKQLYLELIRALLNKHTFCIFVEKQWTVHDVNHQIK